MWSKIIAALTAIILGVVFRIMAIRGATNKGKQEQLIDDAEADSAERAKARDIRYRLATDAEYVRWVREQSKRDIL